MKLAFSSGLQWIEHWQPLTPEIGNDFQLQQLITIPKAVLFSIVYDLFYINIQMIIDILYLLQRYML